MPFQRISTGRLAALIATACAAALYLGLPAGAGAFAWELPATTLSAGPNGSAGADVAVAPDGTTTIVYEWAFNDVSAGTSARWIKAATRPAGQSDFIYSDVSPPGANVGSAVNPRVVVSPNGATTVVWSEGGGDQIFAATRPPGQSSFPDPADKPPQLLSDPTLTSRTPELAAAGDGSVTAVWSAEGGLASSCPLVQYAIRMPGQSSFGPRGNLSVPGPTPCDGYPPFPQLAAAVDGTTTAVWSRHNGSHDTIQSASRLPGQSGFPDPTATPPENLSSPGKNATTPDVAVGANGQTTVVWHDWTSLGQVESATRQPGASTFEDPEVVAGGTYLNGNEPAAQVAYSPDGQTTVVFGYGEIFSSTRAPTSSAWDTPQRLSGENQDIYPRIAVAPDGRETVVWLAGLNTNTSSIRSATRASGSTAWSTPETLAPDTGVWNVPAPRIAVGANGRATAVWTANDGGLGGLNRVQTVSSAFTPAPPPSYVLAVNKAIADTGTGAVTSNPAGIDCGSTCQKTYDPGTRVTLTATPDPGSRFTGWTGACTNQQGPCEVTMTDTRVVTARFMAIDDYRLTVQKQGTGQGTVSSSPSGIECGATCQADFEDGTQVTLTANAGQGSTFHGWAGACSGTGPCQVTMDQTREVTASFTTIPPNFQLGVNRQGNGEGTVTSSPAGIDCGITCQAEFEDGTQVTLTATAAQDSTFTGWSGACSTSARTCTVPILGNRSVTATFSKRPPEPKPSNDFKMVSSEVRGSSIVSRVRVPGPGRISQRGSHRTRQVRSSATRIVCTASRSARKADIYTLTCRLNSETRKQRRRGPLRVKLRTTFAPVGGTARSSERIVVFRSLKPRPRG